MRRHLAWLGLAAVVVAVAGLVAALPALVRWAVVRQVRELTGREATVADVDVNLVTRELILRRFAVAGGDDRRPVAEFERLEARFRVPPLLRGRLHLEFAHLVRPRIRIVRTGPAHMNVADIVQWWQARPPQTGPPRIAAERFVLTAGAVVFDDHALDAPRRWEASDVSATLRNVGAFTEGAGWGQGSFLLAGAPVAVTLDEIRLAPGHARGTLTIAGLELAPLAAYFPPNAAVRIAGGRYTATHALTWDAGGGVRGHGRASVRDLRLARPGQRPPLVSVPEIALRSADVAWDGRRVTAGRLEASGSVAVVDGRRDPAVRYDVAAARLLVEGATYPGGPPSRVGLTADLPRGGALRASGSARFAPLSTDLAVELRGMDLAPLAPYVLGPSPVRLAAGTLDASLDVHYEAGAGLRGGGRFTLAPLVLLRHGQAEPFVSHRRLTGTISTLALRDGTLSLERLALTGAPTIVDASASPPQRFDVKTATLTVEDATWPARAPARIRGAATLTRSGSTTVEGRLNPSTLAAEARAVFRDVDLTRLRPYLGADTPVSLARGRARLAVTLAHDRSRGLRMDADGEVQDLVVTGAGEPLITDEKITVTIAGLGVKDGVTAVRRLTVAGSPAFLDHRVSPPRSLTVPSLTVRLEGARWPATGPADLHVVARLPESGQLAARGRVSAASRAVDLDVQLEGAALGPLAAFVPVEAPLSGQLDARLTVAGIVGEPGRLAVRGDIGVEDAALGPREHPPVAVERITVAGLEARWPERVTADRIDVEAPSILVERSEEGRFPLRAMLQPERPQDAPSALPGFRPRPAGDPAAAPCSRGRPRHARDQRWAGAVHRSRHPPLLLGGADPAHPHPAGPDDPGRRPGRAGTARHDRRRRRPRAAGGGGAVRRAVLPRGPGRGA